MQEKIIIGIDPGSFTTGFGIISLKDNGVFTHVTNGVISLSKNKNTELRIQDLANDLYFLLQKYKPHKAIVEDLFFFKHPRSALILGQARGAVIAILGLLNIEIRSFTPTQVKSLISGQGRAKKFQIAQIISYELKIPLPTHEDASDALSLALAEIFYRKSDL